MALGGRGNLMQWLPQDSFGWDVRRNEIGWLSEEREKKPEPDFGYFGWLSGNFEDIPHFGNMLRTLLTNHLEPKVRSRRN